MQRDRPPSMKGQARISAPLNGPPIRHPQQGASPQLVIDLDAIQDDVVVLSSSTGFPQPRRQSWRYNPVVIDLEEEEEVMPGQSGGPIEEPVIFLSVNTHNKRERTPSNRKVIDCENNYDCKRKKIAVKSPPEPPKEPTLTCPICLQALVEPCSTTCGHIFCQDCIKTAIKERKKCPICSKKLTMKSFHRVYLPTAE